MTDHAKPETHRSARLRGHAACAECGLRSPERPCARRGRAGCPHNALVDALLRAARNSALYPRLRKGGARQRPASAGRRPCAGVGLRGRGGHRPSRRLALLPAQAGLSMPGYASFGLPVAR